MTESKSRLIAVFIVCMNVFMFSCFAQKPHQLFSEILKDYVVNGAVDYESLRRDLRLEKYIDYLAKTDPKKILSKDSLLAFWINAYNAYTLKIICDNYPLKSIKDLNPKWSFKTVWDKDFVIINNKKMSLGDIEHKIIRPQFRDPRVHFALVCAAKGCPILRSQAYRGEKLNTQLDEQARSFLVDKEKNSFDLKNKIANISPILRWYSKDFGPNQESVLKYIAKFLPKAIAQSVKKEARNWKVRYRHYDWSLNE